MCQSSRLFPYVLVTKTKHIFFQVPQQLGSVYWRGWTNFWKNKTLHGSSFVYTGTEEPWKFLNGNVCKFLTWSEESQNWWPNGSTFTRALVNRASFCTVCAVKAWSLVMRLWCDVSRHADLRFWLQKELNISQKCCCCCCLQTPRGNFFWKKVFGVLFDKLFVELIPLCFYSLPINAFAFLFCLQPTRTWSSNSSSVKVKFFTAAAILVLVNLHNRPGEQGRQQTLCQSKRDNNFVWKNCLKLHLPLNRYFCKRPKTLIFREDYDNTVLSRLSHTRVLPFSSFCRPVAPNLRLS